VLVAERPWGFDSLRPHWCSRSREQLPGVVTCDRLAFLLAGAFEALSEVVHRALVGQEGIEHGNHDRHVPGWEAGAR
jgi:hypothetical protein